MILDEIVWKSHLVIVNEFDEVEMDLNSIIEKRIMPTKNGNMKDISRRT